MKKLILVIAIVALTSGCGLQQIRERNIQQAADEKACLEAGNTKNSKAYIDCLVKADSLRRQATIDELKLEARDHYYSKQIVWAKGLQRPDIVARMEAEKADRPAIAGTKESIEDSNGPLVYSLLSPVPAGMGYWGYGFSSYANSGWTNSSWSNSGWSHGGHR
jgi:hypothetical protein